MWIVLKVIDMANKILGVLIAATISVAPAYAISSEWEERHPIQAIGLWAITMPWRVTCRTAKIVAREAMTTSLLMRGWGPPQWADYKSAIELGDR